MAKMNWLESKRLEKILLALLTVAGFILINQLANQYFFRLDLTEEKRFSITDATKKQLQELRDAVTIEIYLAGELPAGFKRMQQSVLETVEEFNIYSGGKVAYQLIDPNTAVSNKSRAEYMQAIMAKGLQPTDVFIIEEGKRVQKRIFVGVVVSYGSRELGVQLFKGNQSAAAEERLNQSVEGIEYELANAIQQVTQDRRPLIGLVTGHQEMDSINIYSFKKLLQEHYRTKRVYLNDINQQPPDLVMLIQPRSRYSALDKYHLDQYIMRGGKVVFLLDKVAVNMDSAATGTYSFPYELDLDDLLFKYGVRINNDLVQDFVSGAYPIIVGNSGDQPKIQLLQWPFFPIINKYSKHVIVRNLDATKAEFVSSIDTVKANGITKTVLLSTSAYSRVSTAPIYVDINVLQESLAPEKFNEQNIAVGYLLEGRFSSFFKNKFLPEGANKDDFMAAGKETSLVVIADGDFVKNGIDARNGSPLQVGFDPYMGQQFANGDLIMNAIQYLLAGDGLIAARAKQVVIRPLDKIKVGLLKEVYQVLNLLLPLLIILILGVAVFIMRKRKYARF
jgi:gliding motility-associatede transport system auxiliary component